MKELRADGGLPGGPCLLAALSGRRAAQDGPRARPGGPERAEAEGLDGALSAGRAAAPSQVPGAGLGRGRSAARVAWAALSACLLAVSAKATNFVKPGDSGSLTWTVQNDAQSGGPMTNVSVSVTAPAHFIQQATSQLGPVASIAPGGQQVFQLDYTISPDATDGETLSVGLQMNQDTKYATNRTSNTVVSFTVNTSSPPIHLFAGGAQPRVY